VLVGSHEATLSAHLARVARRLGQDPRGTQTIEPRAGLPPTAPALESRDVESRERLHAADRGGWGWRQWTAAIAAVLLLILVVQNTEEVSFNFLFIDFTAPLIVALLIAGALGALIGWAAPRIRRGGHRDRA
jgi:uncharacterized integral membrane protein